MLWSVSTGTAHKQSIEDADIKARRIAKLIGQELLVMQGQPNEPSEAALD